MKAIIDGAALKQLQRIAGYFLCVCLCYHLASGFALAGSLDTGKPAIVDVTLPVLTVSHDEEGRCSGKVTELELTVAYQANNRPLLVAVAEDRPSGVGEQFRAAIWSAASTVALERGSTLRGYKLEVTAKEAIDGPSAGAMITFAIMNALDGCRMPDDFVFTGSILPNGSVGYVGGLVQKIEGAKAAGKKRVFIPAYYRAEMDANTGEMVDLKEKCRSLGLEMIPVANIRQAYALINHIKEAPPETPILDLPDKVEAVYGALYKKELQLGDAAYAKLTLDERDVITNYAFLKLAILDAKGKADSAYRAGNLPSAYEKIRDLSASIEGFSEAYHFYTGIDFTNLPPRQTMDSLSQQVRELTSKRIVAISNYLNNFAFTNTAAAAQYSTIFSEVSMVSSLNGFWDRMIESSLSRIEGSQDEKEVADVLVKTHRLKFYQLFVSYGWEKSHSIEDYQQFAHLFDRKSVKPTERHTAIEQLLFNSLEAACDAFSADSQNLARVEDYDLGFQYCVNLRLTSGFIRQRLSQDTSVYTLLSVSKNHAEAIASITAQTVKPYLEPGKDESGNSRYENTSFLRSLLQSAREEALAAIGSCQKTGVECWEPVALVHIADAERDDSDVDKLDVFEKYFQAALDAKILKLMCGANNQERANL